MALINLWLPIFRHNEWSLLPCLHPHPQAQKPENSIRLTISMLCASDREAWDLQMLMSQNIWRDTTAALHEGRKKGWASGGLNVTMRMASVPKSRLQEKRAAQLWNSCLTATHVVSQKSIWGCIFLLAFLECCEFLQKSKKRWRDSI